MGVDSKDVEINFGFSKLKSIKKETAIEILFAIIFLLALLKILAVHGGATFVHESPYQFVAGDMFWMASEAEGVRASDYVLEKPFFLAKGETGLYESFPVGYPVAIAELSFLTGEEIFDTLFHLNFFFAFMSILFIYFILRKINVYVAMFGTPLTLFFFRWPFSYPLNFGAQMSEMNIFLLFGSVLAFLYLKTRWAFVILGLLNGLGFYVHGRESLAFNVGVVIFFAYQFISKRFDLVLFKEYSKSIGITLLAMLPILPLYFQSIAGHRPGFNLFSYCPVDPSSSHAVALSEFGIFKWLLIIGVILVVLALILKKLDFEKSFLLVISLSFIFTSYFCVLGNKTTQIRHFFPFFFAIFLGFLLYELYVYLPEKIKTKKWIPLLVVALLLIIILTKYSPGPVSEYAVSNPYTWDAMKWARENVADDENLLFLYGDNHYQATMFYLMRKTHASIEQWDYASYIKEKRIPSTVRVLEGMLGYHFIRTGLFSLDYGGLTFYSNKSVCDYDYVYFNKLSRNEGIQQYTNLYGQVLVQEQGFIPVYQNELVVILNNPDKGGDCFEEKRFD